jgi:hypothetical protein
MARAPFPNARELIHDVASDESLPVLTEQSARRIAGDLLTEALRDAAESSGRIPEELLSKAPGEATELAGRIPGEPVFEAPQEAMTTRRSLPDFRSSLDVLAYVAHIFYAAHLFVVPVPGPHAAE